MINDIKAKIKDKLEAIDLIAEVNGYEKVGFDSNPAVNITVGGNDSDFWSVATNERAYRFTVRVFIPLKGNPATEDADNSKEQTEETMADVVDAIIDAFDKDMTLDDAVDYLKAAPSEWGYVESGEGWLRTADIKLQANKFINVR